MHILLYTLPSSLYMGRIHVFCSDALNAMDQFCMVLEMHFVPLHRYLRDPHYYPQVHMIVYYVEPCTRTKGLGFGFSSYIRYLGRRWRFTTTDPPLSLLFIAYL